MLAYRYNNLNSEVATGFPRVSDVDVVVCPCRLRLAGSAFGVAGGQGMLMNSWLWGHRATSEAIERCIMRVARESKEARRRVLSGRRW